MFKYLIALLVFCFIPGLVQAQSDLNIEGVLESLESPSMSHADKLVLIHSSLKKIREDQKSKARLMRDSELTDLIESKNILRAFNLLNLNVYGKFETKSCDEALDFLISYNTVPTEQTAIASAKSKKAMAVLKLLCQ